MLRRFQFFAHYTSIVDKANSFISKYKGLPGDLDKHDDPTLLKTAMSMRSMVQM